MKNKEFEEKVKSWGQKYNYVTKVSIGYTQTTIRVEYNGELNFIAGISNRYQFVIDTDWDIFKDLEKHIREELFHILIELAKTPIGERLEKKDNLDLIIQKLKEIQSNAEDAIISAEVMSWAHVTSWADVMNWISEEIEKKWELKKMYYQNLNL